MNYSPSAYPSPGFPSTDQQGVSFAPRQFSRLTALGMAGSVVMQPDSPGASALSAPAVGMTPTPYGLGIHDGYAPPVKLPTGLGPYPQTGSPVETVFVGSPALVPEAILAVLRGLVANKTASRVALELVDKGMPEGDVARAFRIVQGTVARTGISPQDLLVKAEQNQPPVEMLNIARELLGEETYLRWFARTSALPATPPPAIQAAEETVSTLTDTPPQSEAVLVEHVVAEEPVPSTRRSSVLPLIAAAAAAYVMFG